MLQKVKVCDFFKDLRKLRIRSFSALSPGYSIPVSRAVWVALNLSLMMMFVVFTESHDGNDLHERVSKPTVMYLDT